MELESKVARHICSSLYEQLFHYSLFYYISFLYIK